MFFIIIVVIIVKKGFTLVELLGVIVILGIIGLIVTPLVLGTINDSEENVNEMQVETIKRAAKNYANAHVFTLCSDGVNSCTKTITIGELKEEGYLEDKDLVDATTDKKISDDEKVNIIVNNGKVSYEYPVN